MSEHTNRLAESNSPYLLQHAANPVDWFPWGDEALEKAKSEDKMLIVSIGYSACHWCHVMEKECFEKEAVAEVMNAHYVSIKIDREERPDLDEVYMTALQLMTQKGGWPLNVVCLPDGRPVWGATYVPRERWIKVLLELQSLYESDREKMYAYAEQLTKGIQQSQLIALSEKNQSISATELDGLFETWRDSLDHEEGGANRAPKFPMPVNLQYLLDYGVLSGNQEALDHVRLTLEKMAQGGIYDQVGGGFARYSVDSYWKVPHFEKMLYDNAQLISLYANASRALNEPSFLAVAEETLRFCERELRDDNGAFYSALDADSEGEEGKFYVWQAPALKALIPAADWPLFEKYYNINPSGHWEQGNYILLRSKNDQAFAAEHQIESNALNQKVAAWKQILFKARATRVRPGLDDKALTSWNALMIKAYCDLYAAKGDAQLLFEAKKTAAWLVNTQGKSPKELFHSWRRGVSSVDGLIEDYAFGIEALVSLYQQSGEESYLQQADQWMQYARENFEDRASGLFYTRSKQGEQLIARSQETSDNVIPSANSTMAHNLAKLGTLLEKSAYLEQAPWMLSHLKSRCLEYGESYANWARLGLQQAYPHYEVVISGKEAEAKLQELQKSYLPQALVCWSTSESDLVLFAYRYSEDITQIYVCQAGACLLPVEEVGAALEQIKSEP